MNSPRLVVPSSCSRATLDSSVASRASVNLLYKLAEMESPLDSTAAVDSCSDSRVIHACSGPSSE